MRSLKSLLAGLAVALLSLPGAVAGTDLNEVGALLVYPYVAAFNQYPDPADGVGANDINLSTIVTIVNAGGSDVVAHVSFIDGQAVRDNEYSSEIEPNPDYCYECDFYVPLSPNDTEVLVVTSSEDTDEESWDFEVDIVSIDTGVTHTCPQGFGMMVVTLENEAGETLQSNVLLGSAIVVSEDDCWAASYDAIPFQGKNMGDTDKSYRFDDQEYGKMPRIVATDFIAPDRIDGDLDCETNSKCAQVQDGVFAELALFTLGFERQHPPRTDCSVTGFDASEHPFSRSFQFGCWTLLSLEHISSEFLRGNLGATYCDETAAWEGQFEDDLSVYCDEHGWLSLNCRVDSEADGSYESQGGVHGAIVQTAFDDLLDRVGDGATVDFETDPGEGGWARLLYQSVTTGSNVTLHLEGNAGSLLPPSMN